jgi:hypothetical protein
MNAAIQNLKAVREQIDLNEVTRHYAASATTVRLKKFFEAIEWPK